MAHITPTKQTHITPTDEQILVVKRNLFFPNGAWHGLRNETMQSYIDCIQTHQEFLPRSLMEQDQTYKQIIPYIIFTHDDRYFVMQRQASASEQRLKSKFTLGIGGHIRAEDMTNKTIFDWAQREFHEEVNYTDSLEIIPLGILNDDSNDVGKVHVGLVLLARGTSDAISIKSELKSGTLMSIEECRNYYQNLESWSQMVFDFLATKD